MANYLVTGSSRGIGYELVKQLLDEPASVVSKVFAVTRNDKGNDLNNLLKQHSGRGFNIVISEITKRSDTDAAAVEVAKHLDGAGLDVLVNNVGILPFEAGSLADLPSESLLDTFNVNVISAHVVTGAFIPLLRKGQQKKVINISTSLGSIARAEAYAFAPMVSYKVSKTAMNMLNKQYALEFGKEGFTFLLITPGWLKTDGGSSHADLEPEVGVRATKDIIFKATQADNGLFKNILVPGWENKEGPNFYDGRTVPW